LLPSIELRIANVIKALAQVVLPAIDPNNGLAREQAALAIGHLQLIAEQWSRAPEFEARALAALQAMGEVLAAAATGGARTQKAAAELRSVLGDSREPGAEIDALIEAAFADGSADFRAIVDEAVLAHGARQAWRERVWFQGNGLDLDRAALPSIDEMLRGG
jgi:hypothetical protein